MSNEFDANGVIGMLPAIWAIIDQSLFFTVLKAFLFLYSIVLIVNVVILLMRRGITENLKVQWYGATRPMISKSKAVTKWQGIERRLQSDNPSHYKVAVLEADHYADELLGESGFDGENMGERLANLRPGELQCAEELKAAHEIRNRIVNEPTFTLDRAQAEDILAKYRSLLVELELFS